MMTEPNIKPGTPVIDKDGNQIGSVARTFQTGDFDEVTQAEILTNGLFGHIWSADIHVTTMQDEFGWGLFPRHPELYE